MELYKNSLWKDVDFNSTNKIIPTDWNSLTIGEIIMPNPKSKIKAGEGQKVGMYPFFNCSETQTKYLNQFLINGENLFLTTGGDFMFNLYFNGKSSYSTDVWAIKIKDHNTQFIHYFLKYNFETNQQYFRGFKFKHLDKKGFQKMVLPIPTFEEQNAIVSFLSSQENVTLKIKGLIDELEKRNEFMVNQLLSGYIRVKEINGNLVLYKNLDNNWKFIKLNAENVNVPMDWQSTIIDNTMNIVFGKRIIKSKSSGTIPVYGGGKASFFTNLNNQTNKWVIARFAMSKNCVRYVEKEFWLLDSGFTFNAKNLYDENFLGIKFSNMQNYIYNKLSSGTAQKNIDIEAFKKTEIITPTIEEQKLIIKVINTLYNEKEIYKKLLIQEEKKFNFLLEELMSGRLRVKV